MQGLHKTAKVLAALGAIDLGLLTFNYELVGRIIGDNVFAKIIYALVGLSGLWLLVKIFR